MKKVVLNCVFIVTFLLGFNQTLLAAVDQAPNNFNYLDGKAVMIDISKVQTIIAFDLDNLNTTYNTEIEFTMPVAGYPTFSAIENVNIITDVSNLPDSRPDVGFEFIRDPDDATEILATQQYLTAGTYRYLLSGDITSDYISYNYDGVRFFTRMTDNEDRSYIEQFIPSNFLYDQYEMQLTLYFKNQKLHQRHKIYTNGMFISSETAGFIYPEGKDLFHVKFPPQFNASSFFIEVKPEIETTQEESFVFDSQRSSLSTNVIMYPSYKSTTMTLGDWEGNINQCLHSIENAIAPYPYEKLLVSKIPVYDAIIINSMEYSGAVATNRGNLCHELAHQWFGRSVYPADGNAGWIDEGIASWMTAYGKYYGFGFYREQSLEKARADLRPVNLAGHSEYKRTTDGKAKSSGRDFMAYLHLTLKNAGKGGLLPFLSQFYNTYKFQTITTDDFLNSLETYSGLCFKDDFAEFIYQESNPNYCPQ